jgi:hypothetical protein
MEATAKAPKTGRPTIIRGIAITAGSLVYIVSNRADARRSPLADPIEIQSRVVLQSNGETFALTRGKSFRASASVGQYNWVSEPGRFYVTLEEAQRAASEQIAMIPTIMFDQAAAWEQQARDLMAKADDFRKQASVIAAAQAANGTTLLDVVSK